MIGKKIRLRRIFKEDRRTLIVAMDHGIALGPLSGIEDPLKTIRRVIRGGPDALLLNPGILRIAYRELTGKASIIMNVKSGLMDYKEVVKEAIRLGADAIKVMVFTHVPEEAENINSLCELAMVCEEWGIPLMAEMYPKTEKRYDAEVIARVARIAAEAGADFVKTFYTGDKMSFSKVVESCPIPVVILGGPKIESDEKLFSMVRDALDAGACGVVFGRNIWQREDPEAIVRLLIKLIHRKSNKPNLAR